MQTLPYNKINQAFFSLTRTKKHIFTLAWRIKKIKKIPSIKNILKPKFSYTNSAL